ncbi:hypothetical protein AAVH_40657 [Aphelenchoides avenae]|nr:hypothetical protein AAVH_40657 [Aphelenchus avenae]
MFCPNLDKIHDATSATLDIAESKLEHDRIRQKRAKGIDDVKTKLNRFMDTPWYIASIDAQSLDDNNFTVSNKGSQRSGQFAVLDVSEI